VALDAASHLINGWLMSQEWPNRRAQGLPPKSSRGHGSGQELGVREQPAWYLSCM